MISTPKRNVTLMLLSVMLFSLIISSFAVRAADGHITLLTVSEGPQGQGGTADLYLSVKQGSGSIYIDSFPLTKVDTQSSVRYANQIACDLLQKDCSQYDFFYTIRANTAIVGGPSAGGAMTVLTVAVLDGQNVDQKTAMTGTINSGGIIGPVAGVSEKVKGAKSIGIKKVLIPSLTTDQDLAGKTSLNKTNATASSPNDPSTYGRVPQANDSQETTSQDNASRDSDGNASGYNSSDQGADEQFVSEHETIAQEPLRTGKVEQLSDGSITVIRVSTVEQALKEFTGKDYTRNLPDVSAPLEYTKRMRTISNQICTRTQLLLQTAADRGLSYNDTRNFTERIRSLPRDHDYSRASLCFSENIDLSTLIFKNESDDELAKRTEELRYETTQLDAHLKNITIATISDLEAYAIVKERVIEAQQLLEGPSEERASRYIFGENGNTSRSKDAPDASAIAYAQERLVSAQSWSLFFGMPGTALQLDNTYLQRACLSKLSEAEERINYVRIYAPSIVAESESLLSDAQEYSVREPIMCIFTASKAKAQANLLGSIISIGQENVDALAQQKLAASTSVLQKQEEKGFFPVLGYSYTQYAQDLRVPVPYSSLTFAEYALELSNLDMYFPKEKSWHAPQAIVDGVLLFVLGALFGAALVAFVRMRRNTGKDLSVVAQKSAVTGRTTATQRTAVTKRPVMVPSSASATSRGKRKPLRKR